MRKFYEKHPRSFVKVITWRILLTLSHFINGLIVSGSWIIGLKIAGWSALLNSILYWLHERAWNLLQWNKKYKDNFLFLDGQPRTITKMISWRIIVNFSNFLVPYFVTGSLGKAATFFTIAVVINMMLFYLHERCWNRIAWGKKII
jgi:uncharacterized membrane protein